MNSMSTKPKKGGRGDGIPQETIIKWIFDGVKGGVIVGGFSLDKEKKYKFLEDKEQNYNKSSIIKAIKRTLKDEHIIQINWGIELASEMYANINKLPKLEEALRKHFRLRKCSVFDIVGDSDLVHKTLGIIASSDITEDLKHNLKYIKTISLGSGRAVFYAVQGISKSRKEFNDIKNEDLKLVSLLGWHRVSDYTNQINSLMDADLNVNYLAGAFSTKPLFEMVYHPICVEENRIEGVLENLFFPKATKFDICVLGVGVLSEGHNFFKRIKEEKVDEFYPIFAHLKILVDFCKDIENEAKAMRKEYVPIGDICNRLFFVPPPTSLSKKIKDKIGKKQVEIEQCIENVNKLLVAVTEEQLKKAKSIYLIAGTGKKGFAIKKCIDKYRENIELLCIDKEAALVIAEEEGIDVSEFLKT